jgi:hypothetical protein
VTHEQTPRTIALGEEQQTPRGFEIERTAALAKRANDDGAGRRQRLLGRPQTLLALGGADEDETGRIETEIGEPWGVRCAVLGEDALFACPDYAGSPCPAGGEAQADAKGRSFRSRPRRTQLMQRLADHGGGHVGKITRQVTRLGGWTRTHVPYMF